MKYGLLSDRNGNVAVLTAVTFMLVVTGIGAAIDMNISTQQKKDLQGALDSATLFLATTDNKTSNDKETAKSFFSKNLSRTADNLEISFDVGSDKITGVASARVPLQFGAIFGRDYVTTSVKSVVSYSGETEEEFCLMALSKTRSPGLLLNSGANLNMPNCSVQVHSNGNPAMTLNSGITLNADTICVSGGQILKNDPTPRDNIELNCDTVQDPYAGTMPTPNSLTCTQWHGNYDQASVTFSPGVYCGWHNFNNSSTKAHFEPGLYVIKSGGWNVNGGEWTGDGVTFYFADQSKIQFNSGVKANMTPPSSGEWANVFLTEASGLGHSQFILNDSKGFDFEGIVYLPSREVIMNSGSTVRSRKMKIVADSLIVNQANLNMQTMASASSGGGTIYVSE